MQRQLRPILAFLFSLISASSACGGKPELGPEPESRRSASECTSIAQAVLGTSSDSMWSRAMVAIYDCPDTVGVVLAELWRRPQPDSARLSLLSFVSGNIVDSMLLTGVLKVALDQGRVLNDRFRAVETITKDGWAAILLRH